MPVSPRQTHPSFPSSAGVHPTPPPQALVLLPLMGFGSTLTLCTWKKPSGLCLTCSCPAQGHVPQVRHRFKGHTSPLATPSCRRTKHLQALPAAFLVPMSCVRAPPCPTSQGATRHKASLQLCLNLDNQVQSQSCTALLLLPILWGPRTGSPPGRQGHSKGTIG